MVKPTFPAMKTFILLLSLSFTALAQNYPLKTYKLIRPESKIMDAIAAEFEVTKKLTDGYEVLVPLNKEARFKELAPQAQIDSSQKQFPFRPAGYRTLKSVNEELHKIAARYPHITKLETYGTTTDGHVLYVLKVSDNVMIDEKEPELMLTAATHGDEIITTEVLMDLLQEMLDGYGRNPRLTKMINERELFFIPVVNPQGYHRFQRYAFNVDPNRDYPYPGNEDKRSVDCVDKLIKWFHSRDIKGSMDLHAHGKLIMYPWAYTKNSPPSYDLANFEYLTRSMSEFNRYTTGQISKVIYVAKGSSADYFYWKNGTLALGVELTTAKYPRFSKVKGVVDESREMVWRFIENF